MIILALIKLFNLKINPQDLTQLALKIGADVPVCLHQKISIMEGIGDKITPYKLNKKLYIILINPHIILPTKAVFANLKAPYHGKIHMDYKNTLIEFLQEQSNDLLPSAIAIEPSLKNILDALQSTKPILASMSGSGSTFFALYDDFKQINEVLPYLYKKFPQYWIKASYLR
jgi:4-diphosphocytidyl-2-C-methyl-D-erythritol kinase